MATQKISYGTATAFGLVSNLTSLGSSAAKPLGVIDNSVNLYTDAKVTLRIACASSGGLSTTGTIEAWLLESVASTSAADFSDGIDPGGVADIFSSLKNAKLLRIYTANATSQIVEDTFDLTQQAGSNPLINLPKYWSLVIVNHTGTVLAATSMAATYTGIAYTVT